MNCDGCKWKGNEKVCAACNPNQAPNVERSVNNEQVGKSKDNKVHKTFRVQVHSRTNRLADSDGRSIKALIDGLVLGNLLEDDSTKFLPEIPQQTQERKKGNEETIITIEEINRKE